MKRLIRICKGVPDAVATAFKTGYAKGKEDGINEAQERIDELQKELSLADAMRAVRDAMGPLPGTAEPLPGIFIDPSHPQYDEWLRSTEQYRVREDYEQITDHTTIPPDYSHPFTGTGILYIDDGTTEDRTEIATTEGLGSIGSNMANFDVSDGESVTVTGNATIAVDADGQMVYRYDDD